MSDTSQAVTHNVTQILQSWNRADDQESQNQLTPILYDTMRRLARKYIVQENSGYTLQATELVHEAYVRLIDSEIDWQNRQHFYAVAAKVMRRILVDRAREKKAQKRGQDYQRVTFIESDMPGIKQDENILELDEVISQLEQQDERKALIIQLYYFAGLTYQEIALCLELSEATIDRELRFSKAWLASHMEN